MKNGRNILKFLCILCALQVLLTAYLILKVYVSNVIRPDSENVGVGNDPHYNPDFDAAEGFVINGLMNKEPQNGIGREVLRIDESIKSDREKPIFEIWAKAAVGSYLWEHIFGGTRTVDLKDHSIYSAKLTTSKCRLVYKEGPGLRLETVPTNISRVILILNGRTREIVLYSQTWLEILQNAMPKPTAVLVMLGNERCENSWLKNFLWPKGPLRGVFITYDDPAIDDQTIFQWPLGVATYRHFPTLTQIQINPSQPRKFMCNLLATNYPNSSRAALFSFLVSSRIASERCIIKERTEWLSSETPRSSEEYVNILLHSDLTLCPAGFNTETYRVYESFAAGSIPVVENSPSGGSCDPKEGWRLLKTFNAPVIWVDRWEVDLPAIIEKEEKMTQAEKSRRRKKLLNWYEWFKTRNRDRFLDFIHNLL